MSYPTAEQRRNRVRRERLEAAARRLPTRDLERREIELSTRLQDHAEERAGYHVRDRLHWRRCVEAARVVLCERGARDPLTPMERIARDRAENDRAIRAQLEAQRPTGRDELAEIGRAKETDADRYGEYADDE